MLSDVRSLPGVPRDDEHTLGAMSYPFERCASSVGRRGTSFELAVECSYSPLLSPVIDLMRFVLRLDGEIDGFSGRGVGLG